MDEYAAAWLHLTGRIKVLDEKIASQAAKDGVLEEIYKSVPGIGTTSARILANELGDTSQFQNEGQLFKYVGLTPTEHSSGEYIRQGHISRQGKPIIRKMLVQAAWKAIKIDPDLQRTYERISQRAGGKKAIIGIARRLVGRIRSCIRTGSLYAIKNETPLDRKSNEANIAPSVTS